jgi:prefoldin beta subunit
MMTNEQLQYQARAKELEAVSANLQDLKAEIQTLNMNRQKYMSQQSENMMAKDELELLDEDAPVFKLIGPALVKLERVEALDTVNKRLDFIRATVDGVDKELAAKVKALIFFLSFSFLYCVILSLFLHSLLADDFFQGVREQKRFCGCVTTTNASVTETV